MIRIYFKQKQQESACRRPAFQVKLELDEENRSCRPRVSAKIEQAVVVAVSSLVALFTRNKLLDARPLRVREFPPNQDRPPSVAILNHNCESGGIP
jgi:hypothetical protein